MNETANSAQASGIKDADLLAMQQKVKGSNINESTLLATDYLNHFNEIVMLLEMIPDMPDMLDEVKAWQPKSYKDHFKDSTIADKDLAIEAYDFVPGIYREPFEQTIQQIETLGRPGASGGTDDRLIGVLREELQNMNTHIASTKAEVAALKPQDSNEDDHITAAANVHGSRSRRGDHPPDPVHDQAGGGRAHGGGTHRASGALVPPGARTRLQVPRTRRLGAQSPGRAGGATGIARGSCLGAGGD